MHNYSRPRRRYRGQPSPSVLRAELRQYPAFAQRPSLARQTWDYSVHVVRLWLAKQWNATMRPLRWDLFRFRYSVEFRGDVIASGLIMLAMAWFTLCHVPGVR